jgi:hypothetical protein
MTGEKFNVIIRLDRVIQVEQCRGLSTLSPHE